MKAMHMVEAVRRRGPAKGVLVLWEQLVTETMQSSWIERVLLSDWEPGLWLSG
jgi:hypothetical protein